MEWSGAERSGVEWSRVEWSGVGQERDGAERNSPRYPWVYFRFVPALLLAVVCIKITFQMMLSGMQILFPTKIGRFIICLIITYKSIE